GRCIVAKEILHGGSQLRGPFVPMSFDGGEPFRIDHPAAKDPPGLISQVAYLGAVWVGGVAEKRLRIVPGQRPYRGDHAAVVLQVVIAIKDVVLAIVLILNRYRDLAKAQLKFVSGCLAIRRAGVRVTAPGYVDVSQVALGFPAALLDGRQNASPIGSRLAPK